MQKMQKIAYLTTGILVGLSIAIATPALAAKVTKTLQATYNNIKLVVDGKPVTTEDEPFVVDGRTYLPVRAIAEALGKPVEWDGDTSTVYIGAKPDEAKKEILLNSLKIVSASGTDNTKVIDVMKDKLGNVYRESVCIHTYNGVGSKTTYAEYFLNKQYSKLTFTVVPEEDFGDDAEVKLYVDGDTKNLWTSGILNYKSSPQTIEIDVTGQDYIRFAVDYELYGGYIILGNATLS